MPDPLLAELKKLQHRRGESSPFANHLEFNSWADRVIPLLSFSPKLQADFRNCITSAECARSLRIGGDEISNVNSAIGILNQAIASLEIVPIKNAAGNPSANPPNEVTDWHNKALGKISITVIGGTLTAFVVYILHSYGAL